MVTGCDLIVMPRSLSRSIESRCWSVITRIWTVLVCSSSRSDRVVLPWSTWAMMQKLRVWETSMQGAGEGGKGKTVWAAPAEFKLRGKVSRGRGQSRGNSEGERGWISDLHREWTRRARI